MSDRLMGARLSLHSMAQERVHHMRFSPRMCSSRMTEKSKIFVNCGLNFFQFFLVPWADTMYPKHMKADQKLEHSEAHK